MSVEDITTESIDRKSLIVRAYEAGYAHAEWGYHDAKKRLQTAAEMNMDSDVFMNGDADVMPISETIKESQDYKSIMWDTEDALGGEENAWQNHYGVIEDVSAAFDAGALHALLNKGCYPSEISHLWG